MLNGCWTSDGPVTLSEKIIVMADPCMVDVEIKIYSINVMTADGNVSSVCSIDR